MLQDIKILAKMLGIEIEKFLTEKDRIIIEARIKNIPIELDLEIGKKCSIKFMPKNSKKKLVAKKNKN